MSYSHKRKLSSCSPPPHPSSSTSVSDATGRLGDVEESEFEHSGYADDVCDTPSVHSIKRRRSNDWPLNEVAYNEHGMQIGIGNHSNNSCNSARKHVHGRAGASRSPAGTSRNCRHGSPILRVRNSRFVEGSMNDRASEKPPSIFLDNNKGRRKGEEAKVAQESRSSSGLGQRNSGIFKFGKAITSTFNPFGVWSNISDIWKPQDAPKSQKDIMKERQVRAEKAYAELKKSGYKGTVKTQSMRTPSNVDSHIADKTWKAIQEKMDYMTPANPVRQDSSGHVQDAGYPAVLTDSTCAASGRYETTSIKLRTLHDLRKATSALSIPSAKRQDMSPVLPGSGRDSEDSQQAVRKQKSRKDLAKQAKLLKKVSNLEDKLERARRELRQLTGEDDPPLPISGGLGNIHTRQFTQGALPSLPSERLLSQQQQLGSGSEAESATGKEVKDDDKDANITTPVDYDLHTRNLSRELGTREVQSQKRTLPLESTTDSSGKPRKVSPLNNATIHAEQEIIGQSIRRKQPPRQVNLQKFERSGSPGSLGKKRTGVELVGQVDECSQVGDKLNCVEAPRLVSLGSSRSSGRKTKSTPCLKVKKSISNLHDIEADDKKNTALSKSDDIPPLRTRQGFYLQNQRHLEPIVPNASALPSSPEKGARYDGVENVPPVPPVPKVIITQATKASVLNTSRRAGNLEKIQESSAGEEGASEVNRTARKRVVSFEWPEGIF